MDLKSGYPFWAIRNGLMHAFPRLRNDIQCEVAVVGGGISGALIADELAEHGHDVVVVEQRDIGWGSTAASTALVQYEIDTHMVDLAKAFGEADAALAYRACAEAVDLLADKARQVRDVGARRMQSLYYASRAAHCKALSAEHALRIAHGLPVEWLAAGDVRERFGFEAPCALLSSKALALDPYRMTCRLLAAWEKRGMAVYDRSQVVRLVANSRNVHLHLADGLRITARHVVMAAGYAGQCLIKQSLARNRSSYAFVTDPIDAECLGPLRETMTWESSRPYLYMRSTGAGRLMVGGEDDAIDIPDRRDARVQRKARTLAKRVAALFPHLSITPAFAWAGTFAETRDGLPYFGAHGHYGPRVLFAMAYGGNGITYSMLGAGLLRATLERRRHPLAKLFGFARLAS